MVFCEKLSPNGVIDAYKVHFTIYMQPSHSFQGKNADTSIIFRITEIQYRIDKME